MGAGPFVTPRIEHILRDRSGGKVAYECISRAESASPATGSHKAHVIEQQQILKSAFSPR
jgi:2-oxoglutarate dehydrogenase E1 component